MLPDLSNFAFTTQCFNQDPDEMVECVNKIIGHMPNTKKSPWLELRNVLLQEDVWPTYKAISTCVIGVRQQLKQAMDKGRPLEHLATLIGGKKYIETGGKLIPQKSHDVITDCFSKYIVYLLYLSSEFGTKHEREQKMKSTLLFLFNIKI